jgi:hypothetical protein
MQWQFAITTDTEPFVTGDAPVTWRAGSGGGLGSRDAEMTFPIAPRICLGGTHHEPETVRDVPPEHVRDVNRERIRFADRQIFSASEKSVVAAIDVYKELRVAGAAHAAPFRLVIMEEGELRDISAEITAERNAV